MPAYFLTFASSQPPEVFLVRHMSDTNPEAHPPQKVWEVGSDQNLFTAWLYQVIPCYTTTYIVSCCLIRSYGMIMTYSDSFWRLVTSACARSMTRWKQVWMWRRQRASNVWRWGRMLWFLICWDLRLCVDPCLWCWSRYWNKRVSILYYDLSCWSLLSFHFYAGSTWASPKRQELWLPSFESSHSSTRTDQVAAESGKTTQLKAAKGEWSRSHALHTSLLNFAGKRSRLSFPIFRTRLWSLSSSWLWKGNAAAMQTWSDMAWSQNQMWKGADFVPW